MTHLYIFVRVFTELSLHLNGLENSQGHQLVKEPFRPTSVRASSYSESRAVVESLFLGDGRRFPEEAINQHITRGILARFTDVLCELDISVRVVGDVLACDGRRVSAVVAPAVASFCREFFFKIRQHLCTSAVGVVEAVLNNTSGVVHNIFHCGGVVVSLSSALEHICGILICVV